MKKNVSNLRKKKYINNITLDGILLWKTFDPERTKEETFDPHSIKGKIF